MSGQARCAPSDLNRTAGAPIGMTAPTQRITMKSPRYEGSTK